MWQRKRRCPTDATEARLQAKHVADREASSRNIGAAELLAAAGYMTDCHLAGSTYHSWRVALVAQRLASSLAPDARTDIFYAGLLHDVGTVGAKKHIDQYDSLEAQLSDAHIKTHSDRGAALLEQIPGMATAARFVRSHHERWNGRGYPDGVRGDDIPLGSQIIRIADEATSAGCFTTGFKLHDCLAGLARLTHKAWSKQLWEAMVRSTADAAFYRSLMSEEELPGLVSRLLAELPPNEEALCEKSVERIYHVFAALTDAKDSAKAGHTVRVAHTAYAIAQKLKLSDDDSLTTYHAGLVHDCGWVAIPADILPYSGRFSKQEIEVVRRHAEITIRIMGCLPDHPAMAELGKLAGSHHEWLDGKGYPNHLVASDLHAETQILSVADALDAMVSAANYRILSVKGALARLNEGVDTQFDAKVVAALASLVESGELRPKTALAA
jgi:HD-GYP domain-containing protein (c-di-GMP phosphodiesterase class II)